MRTEPCAAHSWGCQGGNLDPAEGRAAMDDIRQSFARQGLIRPREAVSWLACSRPGQRYGLAPWAARLRSCWC